MRESFWGIFIMILGAVGIVAVNLFQDLTITNDQTHFLLKESTKAAMGDSIDIAYYRTTGKIRIVEAKFVENLTRRFAESAVLNKDYNIIIHDIVEEPPKVSISLTTNADDLSGGKYEIFEKIDSIYEAIYSRDDYYDAKYNVDEWSETRIIPGEVPENPYKDGKCANSDAGNLDSHCMLGDLIFDGWGDAPSSIGVLCESDLNNLPNRSRDAYYRECVCNPVTNNVEWSARIKADPVPMASPIISAKKDKVTYEWKFKKEGPFNDIDTNIIFEIVVGPFIRSLKLLSVDDTRNTETGGTLCPTGTENPIALLKGDTQELYPRYNPKKTVNRDLKWTSTNNGVDIQDPIVGSIDWPNKDTATIRGVSQGNVTVSAEVCGISSTCNFRVVEPECPADKPVIYPGGVGYATLKNNDQAYFNNVSYSINLAPNIATIDNNGVISVKDNGSVTQTIEGKYTIIISGNNVITPKECDFTIEVTQPKIIETPDPRKCGVGNMSIVSFNFPDKPAICASEYEKDKNGFVSKLLKNATLKINLCSKTTPFSSCDGGTWDSTDVIPLGYNSLNATISSNISFSGSTYSVKVVANIDHHEFQNALVSSGCRAKRPTVTLEGGFTGSLIVGATPEECSLADLQRRASISGQDTIIPGVRTATYSLVYSALPGDKITWRFRGRTLGNGATMSFTPTTEDIRGFEDSSLSVTINNATYGSVLGEDGAAIEKRLKFDTEICQDMDIKVNSCIRKGINFSASQVGVQDVLSGAHYANASWKLNNLTFSGLGSGTTSSTVILFKAPSSASDYGTSTGSITLTRQVDCPNVSNQVTKSVTIYPHDDYYCSGVYKTKSTDGKNCINTESNFGLIHSPVCTENQVSANRFNTSCYNKSDLLDATPEYSCSKGWVHTKSNGEVTCRYETNVRVCEDNTDYPVGPKCYYNRTKLDAEDRQFCSGVYSGGYCYTNETGPSYPTYSNSTSYLNTNYVCSTGGGTVYEGNKCAPEADPIAGTSCVIGDGYERSLYGGSCYLSAKAVKNSCELSRRD